MKHKKKPMPVYDIKHYDKEYFAERDFVPDYLVDALIRYLRRHNVKKILEVGVGSGKLMRMLQKSGFTVEGIDISPVSAKLTGAKVASATKIPFPANTFDAVIAISLIEHLHEKDGKTFLNETSRVLKDFGIVFMVTPNFASPLRVLKGKNWFGYGDSTHVFFYTPASMKRLLNSHGFGDFRFMFPVQSDSTDWPVPSFIKTSHAIVRKLVNMFFISTPVAYVRDSFWVGAIKRS